MLTRGGEFATENRLGCGTFGVIRRVRGTLARDATVHLRCGVRPILWFWKRIVDSSPSGGGRPVHGVLKRSSVDELLVPRLGVRVEGWVRLWLVVSYGDGLCVLSQWFQIIDLAWVSGSWSSESFQTRARKQQLVEISAGRRGRVVIRFESRVNGDGQWRDSRLL